jgi:parallel beta-helix repeat protein
MKLAIIFAALITLLVTTMVVVKTRPLQTEATNIIVPDNYPTIQEAINNATAGDTVFVKSGTYDEHLIINKCISLIGENMGTTIIDASRNGTAITITADHVTIRQFTIRNGYELPHVTYGIIVDHCNQAMIGDNIISDNDWGVFLYCSQDNIVASNNIFHNWQGIGITLSHNNHILNNTVHDHEEAGIVMGSSGNNNTLERNAVFLNGFCGIQIGWSSFNHITCNMLHNNTDSGIRLDASTDNRIDCNNIFSNERDGIVLFGSNSNIIIENKLDSNKWSGVTADYSNSNIIYHNEFLNNAKQAAGHSGSSNSWDDNYSSGGNYWSDYAGHDLMSGPYQNVSGKDGVGDTPYTVDGDNPDRYPLVYPWRGLSGNVQILQPANGSIIVKTTIELLIGNMGSDARLAMGDPTNRIDLEIEYLSSGGNIHAWGIMLWTTAEQGLFLASGESYSKQVIFDPYKYIDSVPQGFVGDAPYGEATIRLVHWRMANGNYDYGEFGSAEINVTFVQDIDPPIITVLSPLNTTYATTFIPLSFAVNEGVSWAGYGLDIDANVTILGNTTVTLLQGHHEITVFANDTHGNTGATSICFTVTFPEDIDLDGSVGISDIFAAAQAFGSEPENRRWNSQADINADGYIGIDDIAAIARAFGQSI